MSEPTTRAKPERSGSGREPLKGAGAPEVQPGTDRVKVKDKEDTDEQIGIGETRKVALNEPEHSSGEDQTGRASKRHKN